MIVLDTNALSELMRPSADPAFLRWWKSMAGQALHTTSISVAEIEFGVERLPQGRRKEALQSAVKDIFESFSSEILAFDRRAAPAYAQIAVERSKAGAPIDGFDAQIAAICHVHQATLVSRNIKDFVGTGIEMLNPWGFGDSEPTS